MKNYNAEYKRWLEFDGLTEEERNKRKDTLRKELYGRDSSLNNLDYWKKTLELRKLEIESGKKDPFTGRGRTTSQDNVNQEEVANNVAELIQDCIDNCEGSNRVFTALLQNRLEDDPALALKLAKEMQEKFALTNEQASASVSFMDSIKGSIIWIAFIDNADGTMYVYVSENKDEIIDVLRQAMSTLTPKEVIENMDEEKVEGADEVSEENKSDEKVIQEMMDDENGQKNQC